MTPSDLSNVIVNNVRADYISSERLKNIEAQRRKDESAVLNKGSHEVHQRFKSRCERKDNGN